jgi:hypothetical protein
MAPALTMQASLLRGLAGPAVHGGGIKTLWPAFWHQDDALGDPAACGQRGPGWAGHPRARRTVPHHVAVATRPAASQRTGVLPFRALHQSPVTTRRCGARAAR